MAKSMHTICLIDAPPQLVDAFRMTGSTILTLAASPLPFFDLPKALEEHDCTPDLVLQVERLGVRSLLTGLDAVDCPLLFWCIDPHLNGHWHDSYARLFDLVCSTQKAWIPKIAGRGARDVRWLPWFGQEQEWMPWEEREHGLTFVGRITDQRPARKWMVEFLQERAAAFNPAIRDAVPFPKMMELYRNSRIIPNESIFGEVNFRLFEGASCGCMVLGQTIGSEQEELFEPGREMDTYSHIAELGEKLALYLSNDRLTRTMAKAAHARVRAEHLPEHRMQRIVDYAKNANRNRATGGEAAKWTALSVCSLWEAGQFASSVKEVLDLLDGVEKDGEVAAATLRVQAMAEMHPLLKTNTRALLAAKQYETVPELNLAASMAALRVDHFDGAKAFWYRHLEASEKRAAPPNDRKTLLTLWATDLQRRGMLVRPGFNFDPARHLPMTAAECLLAILADEPEDIPTLRMLDTILQPVMGTEQARVGFLSILTLHQRDEWRLALEIALANLRSYRLESGLEELQVAHEIARRQGQENAFLRVLKGRDPSGLLIRKITQKTS
ncbi:glycosyltransferase [Pseudodesulfovibrio sediminis]|uniref:Spore protein YkvP/CgeB glycosyl transferase-like domain-containing protein n=1 Tax=Pseudodesulfovibrio sediminis TaxID=2810563 RepID=A0ABM8HZ73_9BACT|nr:glycosyltransferase [Pseudodesulfovibrio sediminis]BCS88637.1 hypothetical protein PSDVSF_18790 [Pseudodesulfovibrio sediminis]